MGERLFGARVRRREDGRLVTLEEAKALIPTVYDQVHRATPASFRRSGVAICAASRADSPSTSARM